MKKLITLSLLMSCMISCNEYHDVRQEGFDRVNDSADFYLDLAADYQHKAIMKLGTKEATKLLDSSKMYVNIATAFGDSMTYYNSQIFKK